MWQSTQYASVAKSSEYARICLKYMKELNRVLNMPRHGSVYLNRMWICLDVWIYSNRQSSEYSRVLNMSNTIHSVRSIHKLMSSNWEISAFWTMPKIIIAFNYFHKSQIILNLWEDSEYMSGIKYVRILIFPGFPIFQVSSYARVTQGSEYASL